MTSEKTADPRRPSLRRRRRPDSGRRRAALRFGGPAGVRGHGGRQPPGNLARAACPAV